MTPPNVASDASLSGHTAPVASMPSLSLLVCTLGRNEQLERLFGSLAAQSRRDFEIVLVDQNPPGTLRAQVVAYADRLTIVHVASLPGLSRARNVGLPLCSGPLVAFPDDDCWYPSGLVAKVVDEFAVRPDLVALMGRTLDGEGNASLGLFLDADADIDKHSVWFAGNSNSLFVRRDAARAVAGFDETLGVGAATPFGSGEETDFVLRLLRAGGRAAYRRDLIVHHDQVAVSGETASDRRAASYSRGFGRVLRLHRYGVSYTAYRVMRTLAAAALALLRRDRDKARYKLIWMRGTLSGYFAVPPAGRDPSKRSVSTPESVQLSREL